MPYLHGEDFHYFLKFLKMYIHLNNPAVNYQHLPNTNTSKLTVNLYLKNTCKLCADADNEHSGQNE